MSELGPPPAPKPVQMPPMPAHFAAASPAPAGGHPMMMGGGCPPSIGGMGPNLVFNFGSPYGMGYPCVAAAPKAEEKEEPKEEEKKPTTIIVQGDPTWCQPRLIEKKGKKVKDEPCLIM